jgi:hypothetical protein
MFQIMTADQVSNSFATISLVGMVALQTPLGRAGKGEKAEDSEN